MENKTPNEEPVLSSISKEEKVRFASGVATDEFFGEKPLFLARIVGTCRVVIKTSCLPYGSKSLSIR